VKERHEKEKNKITGRTATDSGGKKPHRKKHSRANHRSRRCDTGGSETNGELGEKNFWVPKEEHTATINKRTARQRERKEGPKKRNKGI